MLLDALRRIGLRHTQFTTATCGSIRLKLLKIGAQVRISVRRIKVTMASACPYPDEVRLAFLYQKRAQQQLDLFADRTSAATMRANQVQGRYDQNTALAVDTGVFGVPTFEIADELFWGQDRLDFVEEALSRNGESKS